MSTERLVRRIRFAALLIVLGLGLELLALLAFSPMTFIVFAAVGLPLVLAGIGWYLFCVISVLREKKAL